MPRFRYSAKHGDLIGAHLSTKGGLHTVFERASAVNASAIALFARGIPKLLETPKKIEHESDRRNLSTLRSLLAA